MPPADVPTGADLAAFMGRSDPGYFDDLVDEWVTALPGLCVCDPWTYTHSRAVLAQCAADVESVGYTGGVILSEFGPVFARRRTVQMETLLSRAAHGGFA